MERRIRADKRTQEALEAAGDTEGAKAVKKRIAAENKALYAYCDKEGLTYRQDRTQIYGYTDPKRKKKAVNFVEIIKQKYSALSQNVIKNTGSTIISEKIIKLPDADIEREKLYDAIIMAENDFSLLPDKHRLILKKTIRSVELSKKVSGYSPSSKALVLSEAIEKGDAIHEAGHIFFP